jgi:hypothetical protein
MKIFCKREFFDDFIENFDYKAILSDEQLFCLLEPLSCNLKTILPSFPNVLSAK